MQQAAQRVAEYLRILADPNRLRIFEILMEGIQCNCELGERLHLAPNLISHHLSVLRDAGLIDAERDTHDARWVYYSINRAALAQLHATFQLFFDPARIQPRQPQCGPRASVAHSAAVDCTKP